MHCISQELALGPWKLLWQLLVCSGFVAVIIWNWREVWRICHAPEKDDPDRTTLIFAGLLDHFESDRIEHRLVRLTMAGISAIALVIVSIGLVEAPFFILDACGGR